MVACTRAQFAEAVEEAFGDALEFLHRSRQHRIGRGARGQRAEHRLAQQQDLGEQFRARLVDVAMDQVLQPAGLALQQRQDLVGLAHLPHVVPGRAEHLRRRSRSCAASTTTTAEFSAAIDRMRQRIGTARSSPTMRARPRAARLAGRSAVSSCRGVAKTNSLHLANSCDVARQFCKPRLRRPSSALRYCRSDFGRIATSGRTGKHALARAFARQATRPSDKRRVVDRTARQRRASRSAKGRRGCTQATYPLMMKSVGGKKRFNAF